MMRLTNQRGVSLMLLIIMITIFAGVAIGIVTLLRTRHESYPYQVQPYQALALADAGVQFALRYARENGAEFASNPGTYIGPTYSAKNTYSLGNGQFQLRYDPASSCTPGNMGTLYCKGLVGTAVRELKITDAGAMIDMLAGNALMLNLTPGNKPWRDTLITDWCGLFSYGGGCPPSEGLGGWRISFRMCGVGQFYGQGNIWVPVSWVPPPPYVGPAIPPITVAVSYPPGHDCQINPPQGPTPCAHPLKLARLVVSSYAGTGGTPRFVWDEICDRSWSGPSKEQTMYHWDGVTIPPPAGQYVRPTWNVRDPNQYPYGARARDKAYCTSSHNIQVGTLWNSDTYPVGMDFWDPLRDYPPAAGTKYYVGIVTEIYNATGPNRVVENQYVFTVDP